MQKNMANEMANSVYTGAYRDWDCNVGMFKQLPISWS